MTVFACGYISRCPKKPEVPVGSPGARVTDYCQLPNVDAGNQTLVLWKNIKCSWLLSLGFYFCLVMIPNAARTEIELKPGHVTFQRPQVQCSAADDKEEKARGKEGKERRHLWVGFLQKSSPSTVSSVSCPQGHLTRSHHCSMMLFNPRCSSFPIVSRNVLYRKWYNPDHIHT